MSNLVFVAPFALPATLRFVRAALATPGLKLGLLSQEPVERLDDDIRAGIRGFARLRDAHDAGELVEATRQVARQWGGQVDRLIGVLEPLQVPIAQARERLRIPGLSVEAATNFRDKARMKDVLRRHGLPCAAHFLATEARGALAFAEATGFPLVVKPPAGAGAKATFRVEARHELETWFRTVPPSADQPVLLEEFVTGKEHSFDTASLNGRHLMHSISRYLPTPLEVLENPWIQWCVLLPRRIDGPEFAAILDSGPRALDALGMTTGITHMEWFQRPDGIAISEVAARPPGAQFTSLLSYAHDHDFYKSWIELMAFDRFDPPQRRWSVGAAYLRGQGAPEGQARVKAVHGIETAQRELGELVIEAKLPQPGQPQAASYEGEGYVILRHEKTEVVEQGLASVLRLIKVELG